MKLSKTSKNDGLPQDFWGARSALEKSILLGFWEKNTGRDRLQQTEWGFRWNVNAVTNGTMAKIPLRDPILRCFGSKEAPRNTTETCGLLKPAYGSLDCRNQPASEKSETEFVQHRPASIVGFFVWKPTSRTKITLADWSPWPQGMLLHPAEADRFPVYATPQRIIQKRLMAELKFRFSKSHWTLRFCVSGQEYFKISLTVDLKQLNSRKTSLKKYVRWSILQDHARTEDAMSAM